MNWSSIEAKEPTWWRCMRACVVEWSECAVMGSTLSAMMVVGD